jgi:alpha-glucosidase
MKFNFLGYRIMMTALFCLSSAGLAGQIGQAQLLGDGIARFYASDVEPNSLPPSMSLKSEPKAVGKVSNKWALRPQFGVDPNGRHCASIAIDEGTSLYGTGEVFGPLLRNGTVVECWNSDTPAYNSKNKSLYQSHPWVLAVRKDGSAFGVLADTTFRCRIDLTKGIKFSAEGPGFPVIIIDANSPQGVLKKLSSLIGTMPLPPKWSLGFQQCRWSYYPADRVRQIAKGFRSRKIPCDVIWMDIDYMDGFRIFTFDPNGFANPAKLNKDLHKIGFKAVWMIDPGVKVDKGYFVYDQGKAGDCWVKKANGREYHGKVWPGLCAFPDFTMPQTREWWASLYKDFMATGIDGVWNDMSEPAVFETKTGTMPLDNIHRGGDGLPAGAHAQYHNAYGMLMVKATYDGIKKANPNKRPFVLGRANYIGGQRYAAAWTGDNVANWEHLDYSVPMVLNLGLSGQPFSGADIGGFNDNGTPELFARWMGIGAFYPFSRAHTAKGLIDKEPWVFGKKIENISRVALQRRYRLLPYLYTVFYESSKTGLPVMRPVFFADPADMKLRAEDDAFLIGDDLLVVPQLSQQNDRVCAEPNGIWRTVSLVGEDSSKQIDQPHLKIRGGAIIPLGKVIQNTTQKSLDPLTLLVCLNEKGFAEGRLYEDSGDGFEYKQGKCLLTAYKAHRTGDKVIVEMASQRGKMKHSNRSVVVELITDNGTIKAKGREKYIVIKTKIKKAK